MTMQASGDELVPPIRVVDVVEESCEAPRKPRRKGFVQGMSLAIAVSLALWVFIFWIVVRYFWR